MKLNSLQIFGSVIALSVWALALGGEDESIGIAADILIQNQVAEGEVLSGVAKAAVTEYWQTHKSYPAGNSDAGMAVPYKILGNFVSSVTVIDGEIVVEFGSQSDPAISGRTIRFYPHPAGDVLEWQCSSVYIEERYLPPTCK